MSEGQAVSAPAVDVAAIRAALEAATPGPWEQNGGNGIHTRVGSCVALSYIHDDARRKADAELIVLLRNNAEALLTEVERLRARPVNLSGWVGQSVEWDFTDHLANVDDDGEVSP